MFRGIVLVHVFVVLATLISYAIGGSRKCVLHYELESYNNRLVDYAEAKGYCGDSGRYLAKISTAAMSAALIEVLTKQEYYIGLELSGDSKYRWHDGNQVGTHQPWESANGACVVADGALRKWRGVGCGHKAYYVCQRTLTASANIESRYFVIDDDSNEIICSTPKASICSTTVTWFEPNGNKIPTSPSSNVYQKDASTPTQSISKLVLTKANISHEGNYSCKARVGTEMTSNTAEVSISRAPSIESVNMTKCSSVATVFWKSNPKASGLTHLFKYYLTTNKSDARILKLPSTANYSTKIYDLLPHTNYSVEISACRTDACINWNSARTTFNTDLALPKVTPVQLTAYGDSCYVKWTTSPTENNEESLYAVTVEENFYKTRIQKVPSVSTTNVKNTSYVINMTPNRKYAISVQVIGCKGVGGTIERYSEVCVGIPKAPNNVKKPTLTSHQTSLVAFIEIPDESNGLISCLFVIVSYEEASETSSNEYNLNDLITANGTSGRNEYIAVSIPYSKFPESKRVPMLLGDRSTTFCDLHKNIDGNQGNYAYNLTIVARNKPLFLKEKFRVYIVAAVPYKGEVTIRRSKETAWNPTHTEREEETETMIPKEETIPNCTRVAPPVGRYQIDARYLTVMTAFIPLIILALLLGKWLERRNRKSSENVRKEETHNYQQVQMPEPHGTKTSNLGLRQQRDFHHYSDITPTYEVPVAASAYEEYRA